MATGEAGELIDHVLHLCNLIRKQIKSVNRQEEFTTLSIKVFDLRTLAEALNDVNSDYTNKYVYFDLMECEKCLRDAGETTRQNERNDCRRIAKIFMTSYINRCKKYFNR
jgi:hypothetical protein